MSDLLFSHARVALKYGFKSFNLSYKDVILIPDFTCDVILQPLRDLGINYSFYSLNDALTPDWESVKKQLTSNTKAILMVHYFGQPQNIDDFQNFCNKYNLLLIEDNAHGFGGLFNGKKLGLFGDIGINSPRKTLGLLSGGQLLLNNSTDFEVDGSIKLLDKVIGIKRVHLEEDPASLVHPAGITKSKYVLIDYNRSGNPLVEVVTKPELTSSKEAREFMKSLVTLLQYLGIFDPDKNIIKADDNVSIKELNYVRSEVKNITGFKEIQRALDYEIQRQKQLAQENKSMVQQTRAWDADKGVTSLLRTKETEEDYGYITDPDLVPIDMDKKLLNNLKKDIPELPSEKYERYVKKLKVSSDDAYVITNELSLTKIFEESIKKVEPVLAAKWIRRELIRVLNYNKIEASNMKLNEKQFNVMLELLQNKKITEKVAQKIIEQLVTKDIDVKDYVKKQGLEAVSDTGELEKFCKEAIEENPKAVEDYKSGKEMAINAVIGTVMRKTKGKANPKDVKELIIKLI